jgi:hypothetical protein
VPDVVEQRLTPEAWKALEDEAAAVRDWPEERRALFYLTLYRTGMRVDVAEATVAKRRPR